jgi:integrase
VRYGLLVQNPAEGLKLPRVKKGKRSKPYVTPVQFAALIELIAEPYATMVYVADHTGLQVSELIGLRWRNVGADSIAVEERYCRGDWGPPKSEASNATVPVNSGVISRIHRLKTLEIEVRAGCAVRRYPAVKSSGPDDLVFQSVKDGEPMRDNNILVRHLKPAGLKLGIGWVNWLVLRRSFATWLKMAGADVKDAQALMRHSRASTTLDVYQQFVPESQRKVVDSLRGARTPGELTVPIGSNNSAVCRCIIVVNIYGIRCLPTEESSPEKAGVGGSIPSLATTLNPFCFKNLTALPHSNRSRRRANVALETWRR